jgi:hypothetical protein
MVRVLSWERIANFISTRFPGSAKWSSPAAARTQAWPCSAHPTGKSLEMDFS